MPLLHVTFKSRVLGIMEAVDVILPEVTPVANGSDEPVWDGQTPLKTLYLLHGTGDDHSAWQRFTSIERYVQNKRLAVVLPAGNRSNYTDQARGYDYFTYMTEELPTVCRKLFKLSDRREDTFVAGLSMGGYGAMKMGLLRSDLFGAVCCLSGGVDRVRQLMSGYDHEKLKDWAFVRSLKQTDPAAYLRISDFINTFGSIEEYVGSDHDIYAIIDKMATEGKTFPKLFIAIGTEDIHYEPNVRLRQKLIDHAVPYTYIEGPGIHEWAFWDEYIQKAIDWLPL